MEQHLWGIPNMDVYLVMGILIFFIVLEVIGGYWAKPIEVLAIGSRSLVLFSFFHCLSSRGLCCWLSIWEGCFFRGHSICWPYGHLRVRFYFTYSSMIFCSIGTIALRTNFRSYGSYTGRIIRLRRWAFLFPTVMLPCIICSCLIYGGLGSWLF